MKFIPSLQVGNGLAFFSTPAREEDDEDKQFKDIWIPHDKPEPLHQRHVLVQGLLGEDLSL